MDTILDFVVAVASTVFFLGLGWAVMYGLGLAIDRCMSVEDQPWH